MARTHSNPHDGTPEYKESVRQALIAYDPHTPIDERALDLASCYLWWNGYKDDNDLYADTPLPPGNTVPTIHTAYFVYDILKWTEQNT